MLKRCIILCLSKIIKYTRLPDNFEVIRPPLTVFITAFWYKNITGHQVISRLLVLVLLGPRIPVGLGTIISGYNTDTAVGLLTQRMSIRGVGISIRIS